MLKDLVKASKTYVGKSDMTTGNKYRVTLKYKNNSVSMTYHDNCLNESGKDDFLYALILDGMAYKNCYNLVEFVYEFGYEEEKQQAQKIYNSCKKQYEKMCKLFTEEEIDQLVEEYADF